ncbi:hypothetical protein AV530_015935 [Patagioenas fasciata monilis]|uniref:Uncharacterized protein n=1 Tax=Patagioenas fasciata monilis TaxID=372326 RepID=A0A1V4KJL8_PATFA|nr:hypothetical protein AV530_015935 [Patagioenas fasciata monilis]
MECITFSSINGPLPHMLILAPVLIPCSPTIQGEKQKPVKIAGQLLSEEILHRGCTCFLLLSRRLLESCGPLSLLPRHSWALEIDAVPENRGAGSI